MPYVSCPSCEQVTFTRLSRRGPELCAGCGEPLPLKRSVVPLARYLELADERPPEPEPVAA